MYQLKCCMTDEFVMEMNWVKVRAIRFLILTFPLSILFCWWVYPLRCNFINPWIREHTYSTQLLLLSIIELCYSTITICSIQTAPETLAILLQNKIKSRKGSLICLVFWSVIYRQGNGFFVISCLKQKYNALCKISWHPWLKLKSTMITLRPPS